MMNEEELQRFNWYSSMLLTQEDKTICPFCLPSNENGKDCRNMVLWRSDTSKPLEQGNCVLVCCFAAGQRVTRSHFNLSEYLVNGKAYTNELKELYRSKEANSLVDLFLEDERIGKISIEEACIQVDEFAIFVDNLKEKELHINA